MNVSFPSQAAAIETASDRFQGLCLQAEEGWKYMNDCFDEFPPDVRARLRESPFNICAACVHQAAYRIMGYPLSASVLHEVIDDME